jgi:YD repeat-containing protein
MRNTQWHLTLVMAISLWSSCAHSIVDMKSANYTETWTDIEWGSIKMTRTYNSRSSFDGMTGYGWCTDFETNLEVSHSGQLKVTECERGETIYTIKGYDSQGAVDQSVQAILMEAKNRRRDLSEQYLATLEEELKNNMSMREEFSKRFGFRQYPRPNSIYYSSAGTITFDRQQYVRKQDGTMEIFDLMGRLISKEVSGESMRIKRENNRIVKVIYGDGSYLSFSYDEISGKVRSVTDSVGHASEYKFLGQDLSDSKDAIGQHFKYAYDDAHNLIRIDYPDGTHKELTYDKAKDWATSFTNRKDCTETYSYKTDDADPKNHFTSTVQKVCNGKVTNNSTYEFINKVRQDGLGTYLQTVITNVNGAYTRVNYDPTGRPTYSDRNGSITRYYYDPVGRTVRSEKDDTIKIWTYHAGCRKPTLSLVSSNEQTVWALYQYDTPSCHRVTFVSAKDVDINLGYDGDRISKMADNRGNILSISYGANHKPNVVKLEGVGSITVQYKPNNEIERVLSDEGRETAVKIASIFNSLLDLISPAVSTNVYAD